MKGLITALFMLGAMAACTKQSDSQQPVTKPRPVMPLTPADSTTSDSLTYMALGDSYTIGESVDSTESFPYQLAARLIETGHFIEKPDIIAVTGWTTGDLINGIKQRGLQNRQYDIVTLLIGVNNQYRGNSADTYRTEFIGLLNTAISHAKGGKKRVFVLSIPDWGVTPFAQGRDQAKIAAEIDHFNAINKREAEKAGVNYIDITPASRQAAFDEGLTASDGLHPSGTMYSLWVSELLPVVAERLK
jgi:lysophospholipase L1-like esterase